MTKASRYLLDVNALIALLDEDHVHHEAMLEWFSMPKRQWAVCPFTEAGFIRYVTRPQTGSMSIADATGVLEKAAKHPGYHHHPVIYKWSIVSEPFFKRLHGHKQVTDAYLLGTAIHDGLVLATFDQKLLHLAGEHSHHICVISAETKN